MTVDLDTLCVIGAGTMGTGIAQVAAQAGIRVYLLDISEEALAAGRRRLAASLESGVRREKIDPEQADRIERLIAWDVTWGPIAEADWVIEAVPENIEIKQSVLQRAASLLDERVPLSTNTSTFRVTELAKLHSHRRCFLGVHFFNPVPAMKLVEVIPGEETSPQTTEAAVALCERLGKTPVITPDIPGFVVNRAFAALVAAAIDVWAGGADPEAIDQSVELGLGHRMGPLKSADLVGLDVMLAILRSLHAQTGHARFEVPDRFVQLVESGKLGRKTGEGFHSYPE